MIIKIKYKLVYKDEIFEKLLQPFEYFDVVNQYGNKFDDTPKYILIDDYLRINKSELCYVNLSIHDGENYLYNDVNFWDNGKMSSIKYKEYNYEANYIFEFFKIIKEIIINEKSHFEYINFYLN